jgi:DNA invertase Pin-like site-specific DNA recombinase
MAQFEHDLIRARVKSGMASAKGKGIKLGESKCLRVDIATIQRMRAEGLSFEAVARQTGSSVGTVFRAMQARIAA